MLLNQRLLHSVPQWIEVNSDSCLQLEAYASQWLLDSTSLTQRIIEFCHCNRLGAFRVKLLNQGMAFPSADERFRLKIKHRRYAMIREVVLYCGDIALIYARTVIPSTTLTGPQKQLARLGTRPLGAFLFSQPDLQRDAMEVTVLHKGQQLFDLAVRHSSHSTDYINARRSIFRLNNKPLLVAELFLPTLFP